MAPSSQIDTGTSNMPLMVRVLQHDFPIDSRYHEGHQLTASEANAMNQLLVENVRNNIYNWVVKAARGRSTLDADTYAKLATRIRDYARYYQFKTRNRIQGINPFEAAIRELAWQHAEDWGTRHGANADEVRKQYVELLTNTTLQEEARQLVRQRQEVISEALGDLV